MEASSNLRVQMHYAYVIIAYFTRNAKSMNFFVQVMKNLVDYAKDYEKLMIIISHNQSVLESPDYNHIKLGRNCD